MSIYRQMDEEEMVYLFYGWVIVHYGLSNNGLFSSVQFSCSVESNSMWPHESQYARPPCPSPTPGVHPNSRPLSRWCHPAISSSVVPFSSCPQSLPASESIAAKSLQSCPTLCNPTDGSPPGSTAPGILQARTLEWVAISFSNAWKWKMKVKSLSCVRFLATTWTAAHSLLHPWDFPGKSTGVGCHCLLWESITRPQKRMK